MRRAHTHTPRLTWSVAAVRPLLSGGDLIYALIILEKLNPAGSGQYTAGGRQEEERAAVTQTEKDREREEKGKLVRESRPRVKRSKRIITAKHQTCILTGCTSLWITELFKHYHGNC